jgi:hypothetical protein
MADYSLLALWLASVQENAGLGACRPTPSIPHEANQ